MAFHKEIFIMKELLSQMKCVVVQHNSAKNALLSIDALGRCKIGEFTIQRDSPHKAKILLYYNIIQRSRVEFKKALED